MCMFGMIQDYICMCHTLPEFLLRILFISYIGNKRHFLLLYRYFPMAIHVNLVEKLIFS